MSMRQALLYLMGSPEPEQAPDESTKQYQVGPAFLAALRACSKFVAAPEDSRIVHGVHLVAGGRIIRLESTDGQRLTTFRVPFEHEVPVADVVVPADLGSRAAALFRSWQPVTMAITEHEVEFSTASARVSGRLIEGRYVPFQEYLERILKNPRVAVVNVGLLIEAVKRTEIVTQHIPAHPVVLRFGQHERPNVLLVTDEAGHADTEIENVFWDDAPFTIMLKSDYLLHYLAQEPKDSDVTLRFSDDVSPIGIVGADGRCGAILPLPPAVRARHRPGSRRCRPHHHGRTAAARARHPRDRTRHHLPGRFREGVGPGHHGPRAGDAEADGQCCAPRDRERPPAVYAPRRRSRLQDRRQALPER